MQQKIHGSKPMNFGGFWCCGASEWVQHVEIWWPTSDHLWYELRLDHEHTITYCNLPRCWPAATLHYKYVWTNIVKLCLINNRVDPHLLMPSNSTQFPQIISKNHLGSWVQSAQSQVLIQRKAISSRKWKREKNLHNVVASAQLRVLYNIIIMLYLPLKGTRNLQAGHRGSRNAQSH